MAIPFSPPDMSELEINYVIDALRSGWITTGPKTKEFERRLSAFCGTDKTVCLNSATAAMEMVLHLLSVGPGDEVITSAYTYSASASVIAHVGAKVVLVDTLPDSFQLDPQKVADAITERTKAIIPVDIGGVPVDYDTLYQAISTRAHLYRPSNDLQALFDRPVVLADAAHSVGASYKGQPVGTLGDFTAFSFHAVKNLTTAEGGAVTWVSRPGLDHEDVYRQLQLLSLHGQSKDALSKMGLGAWEYDIVIPGYKCNMTDIMAALGLAQLERFPALSKKRLETVATYDKMLLPHGIQSLQHKTPDYQGNGHLYLARLPQCDEKRRNQIIELMAERGVACNVHFKPLPLMTAYRKMGYDINDFPNAYRQYANEITLPSHTLLTPEDVVFVAESLIASL